MVFWLVHASIIDDSYITLTYARNLGLHGHWGLIAEQTSNTATSPLNVLLLGALTALLRHPVWALGVLFVVANMALAAALLRVMRALSLPAWGAVAAWLAVLLNPLLLSAVGLEVALGAAVLALMLMAAVESRPWVFGVCAGLAVLTRFDLAIVVVVLFAASRSLWRGWWKAVVAAGMVAGPWFVFSWVVLGSFVPDTLLIKTQQRSWGGHQFGEGPLLLLRFYPAAIVLAFLPAVLGVLAFAAWTRRRAQLSLPAAFGLGGNPALPRLHDPRRAALPLVLRTVADLPLPFCCACRQCGCPRVRSRRRFPGRVLAGIRRAARSALANGGGDDELGQSRAVRDGRPGPEGARRRSTGSPRG
ncbi:hypothetical protein [Amycolatopsis sp. NPDC006125]|uniref:hypothetical protein n=1 Tax=Amycolatopsis sp. NPDC006125 TaxID=3156730 RepID=UPI0033B508E9